LLRFGRAFLRDEAGQGLVEYVLIVGVVLSVVVVIAKPFFKTLRERVGESFEAGVFGKTDVNFYYFPLRRR
jgi:Flp pilus assembly pilin Flp